jgi:hypothetical protein
MTYFTPNACGCITQMRGFQVLSPEEPPKPTADAARLMKGGQPVKLPPAALKVPGGPVAEEWTRQYRAAKLETEPVDAGDLKLAAVVHQHRLEARAAGQVRWSVVADGRISSPPVVVGDVAVFGSHDGWVYAFGTKDGSLKWKYLAAPAERLWQAYGQLESTWPVYGVTMHDGKIIASAGTHPELGGVAVVALDPASGQPAWRKLLIKRPSTVPAGGKGGQIVAYSFLNNVPRVVDGKIVLGDGGRIGGSFTFGPDETEQALEQRLSSPAKKN